MTLAKMKSVFSLHHKNLRHFFYKSLGKFGAFVNKI